MRKMLTDHELERISITCSATRPVLIAKDGLYNMFIGTCALVSFYCIIMVVLMQVGSIFGYGIYTRVTNSLIDKKIEEIVIENGFREESDAATRVYRIYSWMCANVAYPEEPKSHNKVSEVLATNIGNCMGQSQLFYLLLQESGVTDCDIIRFAYDGLDPTHVAIAVNIDGEYYIADSTNNLFLPPKRYISVVTQHGYKVSMSKYWVETLDLER